MNNIVEESDRIHKGDKKELGEIFDTKGLILKYSAFFDSVVFIEPFQFCLHVITCFLKNQ